MSKERLDDLDREIEEMEKAVADHASKDESSTTEELEVDKDGEGEKKDPIADPDVPEPAPETPDPDLTEVPEEAADKEKKEKKKPTDPNTWQHWKKRFVSTNDKLGKTINLQRQEIAGLNSELVASKEREVALAEKLAKAEAAIPEKSLEELVSPETREVVGEEALDAMTKITEARVKAATEPIQTALAESEKERLRQVKERAAAASERAAADFRSELTKLVPDLDEIDYDPRFHEFLKEDSGFGVPRFDLFNGAQRNGDIYRVAQFFKEFQDTLPPVIEDPLETMMTPEGQGSTPSTDSQSSKKTAWTWAKIEKHYADDLAGKLSKQESEQQEASIDAALAEAGRTGIPIPKQ